MMMTVVYEWPKRRRRRSQIGTRRLGVWIMLVAFFVFINWWMFSQLQNSSASTATGSVSSTNSSHILQVNWSKYEQDKRPRRPMYTRLLALAAHALAERENKPDPRDTWKESLTSASSWVPCADRRSWEICEGNNGYVLVSANGGINQQRVAV